MSWRRLWPFCFLVSLTCLWSAPQRAAAAGVDVWLDCSSIPVIWTQFLPTQSVPAKPQPAKQRFAQPTAAPSSPAPLTAMLEKKPENKPIIAEFPRPEPAGKQSSAAVREEGPFYDTYSVALKNDQKPANDQCTVTFTNLSERPIKLMVEDQERALARGESVKLPVKRQFIWRMEGREPQNEQVGTGDFALQIVIRR